MPSALVLQLATAYDAPSRKEAVDALRMVDPDQWSSHARIAAQSLGQNDDGDEGDEGDESQGLSDPGILIGIS